MCGYGIAPLSGSTVGVPEGICRAYVYSTPTLADLDHDGKLEVIAATSVGFIYVLDAMGELKPGWPVQMGEIQAQVAVADVNGDGFLELFAVDTRGSIASFDRNGTLLWDVHMRTPITQAPSFGDVNGDGRLDAVFGSGAGEVFALDAATGAALHACAPARGGGVHVHAGPPAALFIGHWRVWACNARVTCLYPVGPHGGLRLGTRRGCSVSTLTTQGAGMCSIDSAARHDEASGSGCGGLCGPELQLAAESECLPEAGATMAE